MRTSNPLFSPSPTGRITSRLELEGLTPDDGLLERDIVWFETWHIPNDGGNTGT
jgi:hypothetical protein